MLLSLLLVGHALAGPLSLDGWMEEDEAPVTLEQGPRDPRRCSKHWLIHGTQLPAAPTLYKRWHPEKAWGTPEMVEVLTAGAEEMAWAAPEADPVVVGDISTRHGGRLEGHKSHRGGLDADIGLYWGDSRMFLQGFMEVSPRDLDARSNWLLIRAMLDTGLVERIFLDQKLVNVLRRYVVESGELSPEEADRIFWRHPSDPKVWSTEGVVHHVEGHKHHMHVRVKCPE